MNRKTRSIYGGTQKGSTPFQLLSSQKVREKKKEEKAKSKKLVNPRMAEYAEFTDDIYWRQFFLSASQGKFPMNFSMWNEKLTYRRGTTSDTVELYDDLEYGTTEIINFMRFHGKKSPQDKLREREETETKIQYTWDYFNRKKDLRKAFYNLYVQDLSKRYNCTEEEEAEMITSIHLWTQIKSIEAGDIDFDGSRITNIRGVSFNPVTRKLDLTEEKIRNSYNLFRKYKPPTVHPEEKVKREFLDSLSKAFKDNRKSSKKTYVPSRYLGVDGVEYDSYSVPRASQTPNGLYSPLTPTSLGNERMEYSSSPMGTTTPI